MKKPYIFFIALFMAGAVTAQTEKPCESCLPEGINFSFQAQVDNFQTNYPNCTEIEGYVFIGGYGWSDITNLDSLNVINSIGGDLMIGLGHPGAYNPNLTSLAGLENLTSIGGNLTIAGNNVLTNLTGLESLTSIGGVLGINNNDSLVSLTGLDNIDAGTNIDRICNNGSLSACETSWLCNYLANPDGSVNIYNNALGCNNPAEIANDCGISIPCLPYGNYYFYSQYEIDSFQAYYPGCTELKGDVKVSGSDINNLLGLNMVISIEDYLYFYDNNVLTSLGGLENLTSIGGTLQLTLNSALVNLMGLDGLTYIGGALIIGFPESISGGNPDLINLTGLEGLTTIGGGIRIAGNDALTSFSGLDNVSSIEGGIEILQNHALISLTGLDNIDAATIGGLKIIINPLLSTCEIESVCAYLASPFGDAEFWENAIGCNSPQEVQDSCEANAVTVAEKYLLEGFSASPNPFAASTTISYALDKPENIRFTVYNVQSQIVYKMQEKQGAGEQQIEFNADGLPAGMYYYRIVAGDRIGSGKLVVRQR